MNILIVSTMRGYSWGGSEVLWYQMALEALKNGHKVNVLRYKYSGENQEFSGMNALRLKGCEIHYQPLYIEKGNYIHVSPRRLHLRLLDTILKTDVNRFIEKNALPNVIDDMTFLPDVILVSAGHTFEIASDDRLIKLLEANIPYILLSQYHDEFCRINQLLSQSLLNLFNSAKKVLFVSERNKKVLQRQLAQNFSNSGVINNPFKLDGQYDCPYPDVNPVKFACVARIDIAIKAQDVLLEILSQEKWRNREWELSFYGKGPDMDLLIKLVEYFGLTSKVKVCGHVDNVVDIWRKHHILLFPSHGEGTPLSLMEAMGCGRTVVATDVGGIEDCVIDGETGFLADWGSVRSFDKTLEIAWNDRHKWDIMGKQAQNHINSKFNNQPQIQLYNLLLN